MKEKLIAFTRKTKNRKKIIIANIVIFAIVVATTLFLDITKINIVVRIITAIPIILILVGNYLIIRLFNLNEKVIRNNKMSIIFLAYSDVTLWILTITYALMTNGIKVKFIIIIPIFIIFMIISECVGRYFRKKLKLE